MLLCLFFVYFCYLFFFFCFFVCFFFLFFFFVFCCCCFFAKDRYSIGIAIANQIETSSNLLRTPLIKKKKNLILTVMLHCFLRCNQVTDIARDDFLCDNTTVADSLTCQNLQVRVSTRPQSDLRYVSMI